ncbi:AzlD domain-containing protein [Microbacterium sp. NPDC055683]
MTLWTPILVAAVACAALKLVGYAIPVRWFERPRAARITDLLTVALLGALVATQTVGDGQGLSLDARLPALAVAVVLLRLRAPFLVVVVAAAVTAALLRWAGGAT